jgi:hypothetical protein
MKTENSEWWTPTKVGLLLTSVVLIGFAYLAWQRNCVLLPSEVLECRTNWGWFLSSPPNEVGDTLAGVASALAFIWIIITVRIQGHELREQRKELELTRTELKLARKAQEKQLEVMQKQADIFADERIDRTHERVKKTLDEMLYDLLSEIEFERSIHGHFAPSLLGIDPTELHVFYRLNQQNLDGHTPDEKIKCASRNAFLACIGFKKLLEKEAITVQIASKRGYYEYIAGKANEVTKLYDDLSADQRVRLESIGVKSIHTSLQEIINMPFWRETP